MNSDARILGCIFRKARGTALWNPCPFALLIYLRTCQNASRFWLSRRRGGTKKSAVQQARGNERRVGRDAEQGYLLRCTSRPRHNWRSRVQRAAGQYREMQQNNGSLLREAGAEKRSLFNEESACNTRVMDAAGGERHSSRSLRRAVTERKQFALLPIYSSFQPPSRASNGREQIDELSRLRRANHAKRRFRSRGPRFPVLLRTSLFAPLFRSFWVWATFLEDSVCSF